MIYKFSVTNLRPAGFFLFWKMTSLDLLNMFFLDFVIVPWFWCLRGPQDLSFLRNSADTFNNNLKDIITWCSGLLCAHSTKQNMEGDFSSLGPPYVFLLFPWGASAPPETPQEVGLDASLELSSIWKMVMTMRIVSWLGSTPRPLYKKLPFWDHTFKFVNWCTQIKSLRIS